MTPTSKLFSSSALALVVAATAHGQASATGHAVAGVTIQHAFSNYGSATVDTYAISTFGNEFGTYHFGNGSYGDYTWAKSDDTNAYVSGYSYASPLGVASDNLVFESAFELSNPNPYEVIVNFTAFTYAISYASQTAAGDWGRMDSTAEILENFASGSVLVQKSDAYADADAYNGLLNYATTYNYDFRHGGSSTSYTFAAFSPYTVMSAIEGYNGFHVYLAAYQTISFTEVASVEHLAVSIPQTQSPAPSPAAVAPFAVGLLGALKRRSKRN